jgi:hypothetical protein
MSRTLLVACCLAAVFVIAASAFLFIGRVYADNPLEADKYPNGCVQCHTGESGLDALLKSLNHADVSAMMNTVPTDCLMCHKEDGAAGALSLITHKQHFGNPSSNKFVADHGAACLACHGLNLQTGEITVKEGAKNW